MKIINSGNKKHKTWWHGKVLTCSACDCEVKLEAGDERDDRWMPQMTSGRTETIPEIGIACPTCEREIRLIANPSELKR